MGKQPQHIEFSLGKVGQRVIVGVFHPLYQPYGDAWMQSRLATHGSVEIIIPAGAASESQSFSITDSDDGSTGFELTSNRGKVLGIFSVDLQPSPQTFYPPVTIIFSWSDEDVTAKQEQNLILVQDGVVLTNKCKDEPVDGNLPDCDMVNNTFTFEVASWSEFTLAYVNEPVVAGITAPAEPVRRSEQPVNISGAFTDADDDDTHTVEWDWGDGTTSAGTVDQGANTVSGDHTYSEAGVYTVKLTLTDSFPGSGGLEYDFVVIYDPEGGFVTGGGWIMSPEGACPGCDTSPEGKASFGFVSKYKKGADTPTGQTEFQFKAGDLNFHSSSYEWLVIAGHKAKYKGTGTINGKGKYGFMLSAVDEKLTPSTDVDLFRIKIWDKDNGDSVVYDNQIDAEEGADPTTAIGGGNIVIHIAK